MKLMPWWFPSKIVILRPGTGDKNKHKAWSELNFRKYFFLEKMKYKWFSQLLSSLKGESRAQNSEVLKSLKNGECVFECNSLFVKAIIFKKYMNRNNDIYFIFVCVTKYTLLKLERCKFTGCGRKQFFFFCRCGTYVSSVKKTVMNV